MLSSGVVTNVPYHLRTFNMQLSNSMKVLSRSSQISFNNRAEIREKGKKKTQYHTELLKNLRTFNIS